MELVLKLRFWSRVQRADGDACWLWKGPPGKYGKVTHKRKTLRAHVVAWEIANGPIEGGLCVLHRCDKPQCVRVDHLFLGTRGDNARDMAAKGRAHLQRNPNAFAGDRNWRRRRPDLIKRKPPRTCIVCSRSITARPAHGRCNRCSKWFRAHGSERPINLQGRGRHARS